MENNNFIASVDIEKDLLNNEILFKLMNDILLSLSQKIDFKFHENSKAMESNFEAIVENKLNTMESNFEAIVEAMQDNFNKKINKKIDKKMNKIGLDIKDFNLKFDKVLSKQKSMEYDFKNITLANNKLSVPGDVPTYVAIGRSAGQKVNSFYML